MSFDAIDVFAEIAMSIIQAISTSLALTNTFLREDYQSHQDALLNIGAQTQVIAQVEAERHKTDVTTQERNTLLYESEQFRVDDLWHMAYPSRQKVLDLREKVFGTGGRRLPTGVRGAHGRFNRVQWTLDGERRLVDVMGRTESEAEEESGLQAMGIAHQVEEEDEEDVVENPSIRPMWLLKFFTSWGTTWGAFARKDEPVKEASVPREQPPAEGKAADGTTTQPLNGNGSTDDPAQ